MNGCALLGSIIRSSASQVARNGVRSAARRVAPAPLRLPRALAWPGLGRPGGPWPASVSRPCARPRAQAVRAMAAAATAPAAPVEKFRKDYAALEVVIDAVDLSFELHDTATVVSSQLSLVRRAAGSTPLVLDGHSALQLKSVTLDGKVLTEGPGGYERTGDSLKLLLPACGPSVGSTATLCIQVVVDPVANTALEGLYKSSGNFCTQCEAEGFRRITFYQDRPDVMAIFTTSIIAPKAAAPVLLSNGNLVSQTDLPDGRHKAVWADPFRKPCYLFALVAGQLACRDDVFVTQSGRRVALRILVEAHNLDRTEYAMTSLKACMRWDEEVFGLEYDLDLFHIVAVDDFNMSLNIFNSRLVLASPATATDADYSAIEGVIGHEYFHNWTGNRVTCRDWFQLTLKEGLTVYRDQEFSADLNSRGVKRISDVARLRAAQFSEDRGPMAHPVRPDSYLKMDNFYTSTVYEKGAEVVRLYERLLGRAGFRKGMDLYFQRHDGAAVTCDDFAAAMADANGVSVEGIQAWYSQAGTPELRVRSSYDAAAATLTLHCEQRTPPTAGQPTKRPVLIPIAVGALGPDGKDMPLKLRGAPAGTPASTTVMLPFDQAEHTFVLEGVSAPPVPSVLRDFSAPVRLVFQQPESELIFLLMNDSDAFNRFEAGQRLGRLLLLRLLEDQQAGRPLAMDARFVAAMRAVLTDRSLDGAFVARVLALPSENEVADLVEVANPDAIHAVVQFAAKALAAELKPELEAALAACDKAGAGAAYVPDTAGKARRALKNTVLVLLSVLEEPAHMADCLTRCTMADNMTDRIGALGALASRDVPQRVAALKDFEARFGDDALTMNKWLSIQAMAGLKNNVQHVRALLDHPAFDPKNPNKCYSLIGGFVGGSPVNFHAADGSGYLFLGDMIVKLDGINAQVAARMAGGFTRWKRYDDRRQALMRAQLERIVATPNLSANVYEIASKSLAA